MSTDKVTALQIKSQKSQSKKIVAMTAYDFSLARLVDELVDIVLVGDSLGMVIQGEPNTLSVSIEDVIYHCRAVSKAISHAHLVADMPFMSYQTDIPTALRNAGRLLSEGKAEAVKLEGGVVIAPTVEKLVEIGIPVMGHVGLTPQSVHQFGGYRVQGRSDSAKESILQDALALEDAGAYCIVLESIPAALAKMITERVKIPTIGIGAGAHCDGQVLVAQDLLGMNPAFKPKFLKTYADVASVIRDAVGRYSMEVRQGIFPGDEHSF